MQSHSDAESCAIAHRKVCLRVDGMADFVYGKQQGRLKRIQGEEVLCFGVSVECLAGFVQAQIALIQQLHAGYQQLQVCLKLSKRTLDALKHPFL